MWTVLYGCAEWQDQEGSLSKETAQARYAELQAAPPMMGGHTADYIILQGADGNTVDSWT